MCSLFPFSITFKRSLVPEKKKGMKGNKKNKRREKVKKVKRHSLPDEDEGRRWLVELQLVEWFWAAGVSGGSGGGGGGVGVGLLGGRGGGGGGGGGGIDSSVVPFSELWAGLSVGSSNNTEPWSEKKLISHISYQSACLSQPGRVSPGVHTVGRPIFSDRRSMK